MNNNYLKSTHSWQRTLFCFTLVKNSKQGKFIMGSLKIWLDRESIKGGKELFELPNI